jgi:hypothetical protein
MLFPDVIPPNWSGDLSSGESRRFDRTGKTQKKESKAGLGIKKRT